MWRARVTTPSYLLLRKLQLVSGVEEGNRCLPPHVATLQDGISGLIRDWIADVLAKSRDLFVDPDKTLGCTRVTEHRNLTTSDRPIRVPLRRLAIAKRAAAQAAVDEMLHRGVLGPLIYTVCCGSVTGAECFACTFNS